jgi:phosphate transport system protein
MPTPLRTAPIVQKSAPRRHDITDPRIQAKAEQNGIALLALQQPVAGELWTIVSSIQAVADLERMGALAVHVAKIARRRHPQHVLPEEVNG